MGSVRDWFAKGGFLPGRRLRDRYAVGLKLLSLVEVSRSASHQHELNGCSALRDVLGETPRRRAPARWLFLAEGPDAVEEQHAFSWYDARARHATRSEWRLYYYGEPALAPGDLLACLHRVESDEVVFLVAPAQSTWSNQLVSLFGAPEIGSGAFSAGHFDEISSEFSQVAEDLLTLLGWAESHPALPTSELEYLTKRFGTNFPSTMEFSLLARESAVVSFENPDETLMTWFEREELLFRVFEAHLVNARLGQSQPFADVDDFVRFSLSVQNRRKSRAGHALENHFEALLVSMQITFTRGGRTEGGRRPDFLLPGQAQYLDQHFPADRLTVVCAKTSCKDRWRQVLDEAQRVPTKHLLTLEPCLSTDQLRQMHETGVVLVAPAGLHDTYSPPSGMAILSVADLIALARERQSASSS